MSEEYKAVTICIKTAGHEELDGIKGGDASGHYHLTDEEYDLMQGVLEEYQDELAEEDTFHKLRDKEYNRLTELLDLLYPDEETDTEEALAAFIDARVNERVQQIKADIINGGEVTH